MHAVLPLAVLLAASPAFAETIHEDISAQVVDGTLFLMNRSIKIGIDLRTGAWRELEDRPSGRLLMSAAAEGVDVRLGQEWLCAGQGGAWQYAGRRVSVDDDSVVMEVDQKTTGWKATVSYRLWPTQPIVQRGFSLAPTVQPRETVRGVRLVMDGIQVPGATDARYSILANWPPHATAFRDMVPGRQVAESFGSMAGHFVVVHSEREQLGLVATLICDTEGASAQVTEQENSIRIGHSIGAAYRPRADEPQHFGSQFVRVARGSWREALRQGRDLYDVVGLGPPADMRGKSAETVLYSAHVGGTIDSGFRDIGGFAAFTEYLPELKRLGVNVLWLLPFWKGRVYAPVDYFALDPGLGTEEELKELVNRAHAMDIRVLGDLIPHGPRHESGLHEEHRDWISTNEDGTVQYWWGCLSCDYAHPGWQDYMGQHAAYWVEKVGLDGYRVDCAMGGPHNWTPYGNNRPSMSGLYGGLGVLRAARQRMREVKEEVLLLAEAAGPPLVRYADYAYDWPLCLNILREYPNWRAEEFVPRLAQWLDNEQYWLPKGTNLIHFLENHDLVRARLVYGPGPERALAALCAYIPGTPFLYHLQEIGMAPYLAQLYEVRRRLPELAKGEADFLSVQCDRPSVLVFTRTLADDVSLVAINLSGERQECTLTLPTELRGFAPLPFDALNAARVRKLGGRRIRVALSPFEAAVIPEARRGIPRPPEARRPVRPPVSLPPQATEDGADVIVRNSELRLTVDGGRGGVMKALETADGGALLSTESFEEGKRRLWLGTERLSLGRHAPESLVWERKDDSVVVRASGQVRRHTEREAETVMDYTVSYRVGLRAEVSVTYRLKARKRVDNVLGSLLETLRFDPEATEWHVSTMEGELHDWTIARRPSDRRYGGRYWHGTGDRVWQSRQLPLAVGAPVVGVRSQAGRWVLLDMQADYGHRPPDNVTLKMRKGDVRGPHAVIEWLDGEHAVTLEPQQTLTFGYWIRLLGRDDRPPTGRPVAQQFGPVRLRVRGSRYELSNGKYVLAVTRYGGGRIADLRLAQDGEQLVNGSRIYTDAGIYPERTLPTMAKVRNFVATDHDPETEVRIDGDENGVTLTFESYLRSHDGRAVPSPRTRYRLGYSINASDALKVRVAVKPLVTIPDAQAFLAQTLVLPRFDSFIVNARDGEAEGMARNGSGRVWESKKEGFADDPWMVCKTGTGRALRIAGPDLDTALQNAFLLRGRGENGVVFLAFNAFEPADIEPIWHEAEYTITPMKEAR